MGIKNKMSIFLKNPFLKHRSIHKSGISRFLSYSTIREIVRTYINESYVTPLKIVDVLEKYVIDDVVIVIIGRLKNKIIYSINEPMYNEDTIEAITKLYIANPNCTDNYCIQETISSLNDDKLMEIYTEQSVSINYYYRKLVSGYGPIYPLIKDSYIEEISANSSDSEVQVIHRKYSWYGWISTNIKVNKEAIDRLVLRLARKMGKHISIAQPVAEGLTEDGLRISLTYSKEVSRKGSSFVIRKKPSTPWSITKLIDMGMLNSLIATYAWLILELRGSILIVGGMSTGKTTLLQGLLTLIPPTRRVVTIEDTPEISGTTGYWDPLVERVVSIGDSINIDMYDLLKFSLRRRADYIVVGEVRGREARLLIQASRLGHGVLATIHGENADSVIERLVAPPISIPKNLLSSIWSIIVLENVQGHRRVKFVYEIDKKIRIHEVFRRMPGGKGGYIPRDPVELVKKTIRLAELLDEETLVSELVERASFLDRMVARGIFDLPRLGEELMKFYYEQLGEETVAYIQ